MTFLTDGTVSLRPVEREDLPLLAEWRNDPEIRQRTREFRPLNMADQERWWPTVSQPATRNLMFVVEAVWDEYAPQPDSQWAKQPAQHTIGVVGLCHIDWRDRTAEISFYVGEEGARGKGYAKRALVLLHDYGFNELGLERIWAEAFKFNEPSIKLLTKLGYVIEGTLRKHVWRMGKRWDSVMMGLLREEWESR